MLRFAVCGILLLSLAVFCPVWPALTVESPGAAIVLPLKNGEEFSIKYTHSVNRSPVIDTIERTGSTLTVRSSLFLTYGAGIPVLSDQVGDTYTETEDGFLLSGIDSEHEKIDLITGTYADHRLIYGKNEFILKQYFGEKTHICFEAGRASAFELLRYRP
ncbi:MAG: DUF1850 domain-containing protein [Candidatus Heteroscillospira sp.]